MANQYLRVGILIFLVGAFLITATVPVLQLRGDGHGDLTSLMTELFQPAPMTAKSRARSEEIRLAFTRRRNTVRTHRYLSDTQLIQDAVDHAAAASAAPSPPATPVPKIAFLFIVRGEVPFEPLWRRFFQGHEDRHSIYVHATPGYRFPSSSLFFGKEIPGSKPVARLSASLANAMRRLFAVALLDPEHHNAWFVNLCEATVPLRSFEYTHRYLMGSHHSFIQAFSPVQRYHDWFHAEPAFPQSQLRKGELWMALRRKHAVAVLQDCAIYAQFKAECSRMCGFDEQYFATLLQLRDPAGIANRTVMFVDWAFRHTSSPRAFGAGSVNASMLDGMASLMADGVGMQHDTGVENGTVLCRYNGVVSGAPCFLFARKFRPDALHVVLQWFEGTSNQSQIKGIF